jgi:peptide/nickel transport system permease protein
LNEEYVLTLKAKGLSELAIFKKHILKNISLPIITMATSNIISLISGSIIIENIFGLPGIGNYLIKSIQLKDFPVILGFVFIMSFTVVILNLISELIGYALDPRIRMEIYGK